MTLGSVGSTGGFFRGSYDLAVSLLPSSLLIVFPLVLKRSDLFFFPPVFFTCLWRWGDEDGNKASENVLKPFCSETQLLLFSNRST